MHCLAADSRLSKNPGMPPQCLMCLEVAISERIHVRRQKRFQSALRKFQRFTGLLWAGTLSFGGVMREGRCCEYGNFPRTRLFDSQLSWTKPRRPGLGWCRRSIGERRSWLFSLGVQQSMVVGCCPGSWDVCRIPS